MKVSEIPRARLAALNAGAEATNLTECLAVDFNQLLKAAFPKVRGAIDAQAGIVQRMAQVGALLQPHWREAAAHRSDTVRGWAAFAIAARAGLSFAEQLSDIRPLAADPHFGVREWAWLALRPQLVSELPEGLRLVEPWTHEPDANLRRFASEFTRPRGVWCAHLNELKQEPERGLPILEPLRADDSRYVQDSVANWLNDAGKTQPAWVRELCAKWLRGKPPESTKRICQRAQRNL